LYVKFCIVKCVRRCLLNRQKTSQNISCKITENNILMMITGILINNKTIRQYWCLAVQYSFSHLFNNYSIVKVHLIIRSLSQMRLLKIYLTFYDVSTIKGFDPTPFSPDYNSMDYDFFSYPR
jgi:hypothetical protein